MYYCVYISFFVLLDFQLLQNIGENDKITVNTSNLPISIKMLRITFPVAGINAYDSTAPTEPRPGPTLPSVVAVAVIADTMSRLKNELKATL